VTAWSRLLGFHDSEDLRDADLDTLRYRVWHLPVQFVRHARQRVLEISPDWPWEDAMNDLASIPMPSAFQPTFRKTCSYLRKFTTGLRVKMAVHWK
jgi:hypothetical protein